jgi:RNA:NAD 2'-phosphotransferase (TPT1/KptA family)
MLLRHATLARNLPSIIKAGLLTSKSEGKLPAVWLCSAAKTLWAAAHVVRRHGGRIESVVVLEIDVPRSWLRRSKKGLWYCDRDIPPERIRYVVTFGELSRSPVEEAAGC